MFVRLACCGITLNVLVSDLIPSLESGFVTHVTVCLMHSEDTTCNECIAGFLALQFLHLLVLYSALLRHVFV